MRIGADRWHHRRGRRPPFKKRAVRAEDVAEDAVSGAIATNTYRAVLAIAHQQQMVGLDIPPPPLHCSGRVPVIVSHGRGRSLNLVRGCTETRLGGWCSSNYSVRSWIGPVHRTPLVNHRQRFRQCGR